MKKIVVAGYSDGFFGIYFGVARYTSTGMLDNEFSGDGKVLTGFGNASYAYSVAIQSDNKIVVAGYISNGDFALARYNGTGIPDVTFSGDGEVITDFGNTDYGKAVAIQGSTGKNHRSRKYIYKQLFRPHCSSTVSRSFKLSK
jgi:uncharacterized delta-60 repeat protein